MLTEENKINDKNILINLLKKILNDSLIKLEKRNEEQNNDLKFIQKNYSEFTKNLDFLVNEVEENEKNNNNNNDINKDNKENNDKNFKSLEKKIKIPQNSNTPKGPLDKRKEFKRSATTSGKLKSDEKNKKSDNKNDSKDGKELKNNKSDISKNIINNKRKTITNFNLNEKTLKNISNNVHNSKEKNKVKDNKDNKKNNSKEKPLTSRNEDPKGKKMSRSKTEKNINEGPGKNKSKISSKFGKEKDKKDIKKETKKIEKKDKKKEDKKEEKKEEEKKEDEIKNEEKKEQEKKEEEKKENETKDENNKEEEEKKIELDIKKVEINDIKKVEIIEPNQEESKKEENKKEEKEESKEEKKEEEKKEEPKEEKKEEPKKEEKKEEPKKEIPPFSSSTFIIPEYNKEKYFDTIMSYLTVPEQLTFYSSSKKLKNKLIPIIISYQSILHKELEIDNPLRIEDRINDFKQKHSEEEINKSITEFSLSKGTIKAIELLNNELYDKIFKKSILEDNLKEILIIYRILFYLLSENEIAEIKDENLFWNKMREYLLNKSEGKIGTYISNSVKNFNFNNKTIYIINKLVKDIKNKIIPSYYTKICGTTGLVVFLIKDALEYCGIIYSDKKTQPSIIYKNLEYEKEQVYKIHNYIEFLNKL